MRVFIRAAGFEIVEEWVAFHEDGILFSFGRIAGVYDDAEGKPRLSIVGRLLALLIPVSWAGHMLCYVVYKPATSPESGRTMETR